MAFRNVTQQDIDHLVSLLDPERVLWGDCIVEDYTHDEMQEYGKFLPDVVVEPVTAEEVSAVMKYAYDHDLCVTPRGAGTGLCGGCVPIHGGILLSTHRMDKILDIDEETLTGVVEPGVLLMTFAAEVLEHGLLYPPDPGEKTATLGGNIMTNAGGMRAVKYGVTRDYVRAIEFVLPSGEIMQAGSNVAKNSSGYGIKDLLIGSEGTLGIVTKLTLKLVPAPLKSMSLLVPFPDIHSGIAAVPKILTANLDPTALEFMQKEIIEMAEHYLAKSFPDKSADAYLLLTFDRNSQYELDDCVDRCAKLLLSLGALDVFVSDTEERQDGLWKARGAFLEAIKSSTIELDECDVVVPRNRIADFLLFVSQVEREEGARMCSFGHAGDGNLHVYACRDDMPESEWQKKCHRIMQRLYDKARDMGGQVSGEHGIGHAKREFFFESMGDTYLTLIRGIKHVFDPKGILNPGKVI